MRVRGLKLLLLRAFPAPRGVAPHAGAWIETHGIPDLIRPITVAPHAGAWIETE